MKQMCIFKLTVFRKCF